VQPISDSTRRGADAVPTFREILGRAHAAGRLDQLLAALPAPQLRHLGRDWGLRAKSFQYPPRLSQAGLAWTIWLFLGGRGAGKTYAGAQWVRGLALGLRDFAARPVGRIALVGETADDVRHVMVEGVSGILAAHAQRERPRWLPSRRQLVWDNGAVAQAFSAEDPESLRGPQFEAAWCDELAKWRHADATWNMLQFGLRLGERPRRLVTTTPRPMPLLRRLLVHPRAAITRARTHANAEHLAPDFLAEIEAEFAGTRLGRQEIDGEIVEDRVGALWTRDALETLRGEAPPALKRIVVAVDPPASSSRRADCCGIVAAGLDAANVVHVLADATLGAAKPGEWARVALALYHRLQADALVAEVNQGGEMVAAVIAEADASVPVVMVRASRGKYLRAAPVAQLYEQGRARHAGRFPALEDEMCGFGPDGLAEGRSPDRLDALVWAISYLALTPKAAPRLRAI
jgi:phage terminase large subunit-like protein